MARTPRPELAVFHELNAKEKATGIKTPWKDRYALIREYFPVAVRFDWRKAFQDYDDPLYGRIIRDILEHDQKALNKERQPFDPDQAKARLRQLSGDDYTSLPFVEAFGVLAGKRSIRHIQTKFENCGLDVSRGTVWKLKNGLKEPDLYTLEKIAEAFNKHPSYFVEYRIYYILGALGDQMDMAPELTVDLYRRLQRKKVKS